MWNLEIFPKLFYKPFGTHSSLFWKIRPQIFDITQFGSMLQTTFSVEDSLRTLIGKLLEKDKAMEELQLEVQELKKRCEDKEGKVSFLAQEVKVYKEQCQKYSVTITTLSKQQEEFEKRKTENDEHREKSKELILKLKDSSEIDKITIKNLRIANMKISAHFNSSLHFQKVFMQKIVGLQKTIETLGTEHEHIFDGFHQFELAIDNLNNKLTNISKIHSATEYKIKRLNGDCSEDTIPSLMVKFKEYKEKVKERTLAISINDIENVPIIPKFQIKGDPLEDISRQMEENIEKIRQLNEENARLQIIVSRFKCIRK